MARTGAPRRLKPFDLYYHMYAGEKRASLKALSDLVTLAKSDEFISLWTSDYAAIAASFPEVRVEGTGENRWRIDQRGALHTLRLDRPGALRPDLDASNGVLGARMANGSLYVALDPAIPVAELVLSTTPARAPALVQSGWDISELERRICGFAFTVQGVENGKMVWNGLPAGLYPVRLERGDAIIWSAEVTVGANGRMELDVPVRALEPTRLTAGCLATGETP